MTSIRLAGIQGINPRDFLAALGLLRVLPGVRVSFAEDGTFQALLDGFGGTEGDLLRSIANDAQTSSPDKAGCKPSWYLTYTKAATKKEGPKLVADLKAPPEAFKEFLGQCVKAWCDGAEESAAYAAAYGTDIAVDGKGNTKPTAFHFTAAKQNFLEVVEGIRSSVHEAWVKQSLFEGDAERKGSNLRWDPNAERNWALMAGDPGKEGTQVNAPLEWLAFRGLPLLPSFPRASRVLTTGVFGCGEDMTFTWPLWSLPATVHTVRSIVHIDWTQNRSERVARGIFAVCRSAIRRTSQGFGNFGPSSVLG